MDVEKDVEVQTRNGMPVVVDVFRPAGDGRHPAIVTMGGYNKDSHWEERYPRFPSIELSEYSTWETPDPCWWVPRGYALVRADVPGTGKSPGFADPFGTTEQYAYYDAIEWAAEQPWCTGRVGALGISYLAITQWLVAALGPPHLTAIIPWEGLSDFYREWAYQGGILANAHNDGWWNKEFPSQQYGYGERSDEELAAQRADWPTELRRRPFDDEWYRERSADLSRITVPLLSAANWSSLHLHLRGNTEGFVGAASEHKWMVVHSGNHVDPFYSEYGRQVQEQFLDCWLKGVDNGMLDVAPVRLAIRHGRDVVWRDEREWPLARTQWTEMYLNAAGGELVQALPQAEAEVTYPAPEGEASFETEPATDEIEITGPVALNVWVASTNRDMDLFVTLRHVDSEGQEVKAEGPHGFGQEIPMAMGWLRASHRELDIDRSLRHRPFHLHQRELLLTPGEPVLLAVEIWPTSITLAPGERLRLEISANDEYADVPTRSSSLNHNDPEDRPASRFAGENTILTGGRYDSHLLLPIIPTESPMFRLDQRPT
ncbi:MAG: CocE/NonD family hydrolase [Chloroflexi bacterium]|nr:CocE/NonD family hydrolase [Chloroflexota bacterium]